MPRSAAGKAAREQKKLSASAAWKQGHVGGRGRGKFGGRGGGGGRGGRWGHDGRDARHRETHPDHARASARANDGDAEEDVDDDDLDPLAAIGSGDAYSALLASLRGGSGDDPDQDYAEALAARDSDEDDSDEDDSDEDDENEREDGSDEANDLEGRAGPTAADADDASDSDPDPDPDAELADADPAATAWDNRDDEADAEEGDEEDAVISDEDEDDAEAAAAGGGEDPSAAAATSASTANHGLATHLRRVVDADVAARLSATAPKYKRADDDDDNDGGGEGDDAKPKSKSKSKKTTTADASGCSSAGGWWEFDRVAREDGASVRGAPSAPASLPAKLKERWNALRDPASASRAAKRARSDVKAAKGNKVAVEAAKAKAAAASAATPPAPFASKTQAEFHALLEQYRDVVYTERATPGSIPKEPLTEDGLGGGGDDVMDAYLLHAVAHVMRTRQRVTKNNEALLRRAKAAEAELAARRAAERAAATEAAVASALASGGKEGEKAAAAAAGETPRKKPKGGRVKVEDDLPRDQGFVRPTVLILAPMRNVAGRIVRRLLQLCPAAHGRADAVNKLDRFAEDFGAGDSDEEDAGEKERRRKKGLWMPEDHAELFRGNTDDHFRLGIKVTKASVRLYVDFFGSDILVASPLGLVTRLQESGASASDFLASLELIVVDNADVIQMQNWQHVQTVFRACNALPKDSHGVDVMRVHETHLEGLAKHHRQTVVLASRASAEINALTRDCANVAGRARWRRSYAGVLGAAAASVRVAGGLRQQFERLPDVAVADADDARFKHFARRVLPRLRENPQPGALVFVPDYFDFVRVRNLLTAEEVSFCVTSEYTPPRDAARARSLFADGRKRVLLVTERAHFYHRRRVRGVREVHFYGLPECAEYYAEMLGFLGAEEAQGGGARVAAPTSTAVFSRLDALRLERVAGSARAKKMLAPEANSTFVFVA